jgi:hypothetical protein
MTLGAASTSSSLPPGVRRISIAPLCRMKSRWCRKAHPHSRVEVRAQRLHRLRGAAKRPPPLESARRHSVWASVSRAVRTPVPRRARDHLARPARLSAKRALSRISCHGELGHGATELRVRGTRRYESATACNRTTASRSISLLSTTTTISCGASPLRDPAPLCWRRLRPSWRMPRMISPGETYGGEISATWRAADWWRVRAHYSLLFTQIHRSGRRGRLHHRASSGRFQPTKSIRPSLFHGSPWDVELDATCAMSIHSLLSQLIAMSCWICASGWRPTDHVELSIVGTESLPGDTRSSAPH